MEAVNTDVMLKIATQMSEMVSQVCVQFILLLNGFTSFQIDWDATRTEQRLQIADGVDERIDEWRQLQGRKCQQWKTSATTKLTQSIYTELPEILVHLFRNNPFKNVKTDLCTLIAAKLGSGDSA
jgi:hypothetical protein